METNEEVKEETTRNYYSNIEFYLPTVDSISRELFEETMNSEIARMTDSLKELILKEWDERNA